MRRRYFNIDGRGVNHTTYFYKRISKGQYEYFLFNIMNRDLSNNFNLASIQSELNANVSGIDLRTGQDIYGYFSVDNSQHDHLRVWLNSASGDFVSYDFDGAGIIYFSFRNQNYAILLSFNTSSDIATRKLFDAVGPDMTFMNSLIESSFVPSLII